MRFNVKGLAAVAASVAFVTPSAHAAKPHYTIVGNNDADVAAYWTMRPEALTFLQAVQSEMANGNVVLAHYRANGLTPEVRAQSQRIAALQKDSEARFGTPGAGPLGHCSTLGVAALNYWQDQLSATHGRVPLGIDRSHAAYMEAISDCRKDISSAPRPTVTVEDSPPQAKPPALGCLMVVVTSGDGSTRTQWSCPKASLKLLTGRL